MKFTARIRFTVVDSQVLNVNSKQIAYIFPGQGSQAIGMGHALSEKYPLARRTFEEADDILGFSISNLAWKGPERDLTDTVNTQPAMLTSSVAVLRVLQLLYPNINPVYVAGHSMGQISALVASGAMSFSTALNLARTRGEIMKEAGEQTPGKMAAILGLDIATVEMICAKAGNEPEIVEIANDNCPGQVVISGSTRSIERAYEIAKQAGARRVRLLAVSIPAHSSMMTNARFYFRKAVKTALIKQPEIPIISNVNASLLTTVKQIRTELEAQFTNRVRWTESIEGMINNGVSTFLELGSKSVLTGLLKRINRSVTGISIDIPDDFNKLTQFG